MGGVSLIVVRRAIVLLVAFAVVAACNNPPPAKTPPPEVPLQGPSGVTAVYDTLRWQDPNLRQARTHTPEGSKG